MGKEKSPLTMALVKKMEDDILFFHSSMDDKPANVVMVMMLGFALSLICMRACFSDAVCACAEPEIDESRSRRYALISITTVGELTKTGKRGDGARKEFLLMGLCVGITGRNWAHAYMVARKRLNFNAKRDQCLLRCRLLDGSFGNSRMSGSAFNTWFRKWLARRGGVEAKELGKFGSHSLKKTMLSVACKGGMSKSSRRILGYHAEPGDKVMRAYGPDDMAEPVRKLSKLIEKLHKGTFAPDETRTGRWIKKGNESSSDDGSLHDSEDLSSSVSSDSETEDADASHVDGKLYSCEFDGSFEIFLNMWHGRCHVGHPGTKRAKCGVPLTIEKTAKFEGSTVHMMRDDTGVNLYYKLARYSVCERSACAKMFSSLFDRCA